MRRRICGCHSHDGFRLSPEGLAQRELLRPEVDAMAVQLYLDEGSSVSGLELERDLYVNILDSDIDEQARRFHSGS